MNSETLIRGAAVLAAVALIAAPHWRRIAEWVQRTVASRPGEAARLAAALLLMAVACGWSWLPKAAVHLPAITLPAAIGAVRLAFGFGLIGYASFLLWWRCRPAPSDDLRVLRDTASRTMEAVSLLMMAAGMLLLGGGPAIALPSISWQWKVPSVLPSTLVTAGVYVYEKDDGPVPAGVSSGIDRLNREKKITASMCEDDTVDGTGEVPEQYRVAVDAARKAPLPAFVVLSGSTVIKVVKSPKAEEEIVGAVP